jgi:hypothetical protein
MRRLLLPRLGRLRVANVLRAEIEAFHPDVSRTTPTCANRALQLLTKMFNLNRLLKNTRFDRIFPVRVWDIGSFRSTSGLFASSESR